MHENPWLKPIMRILLYPLVDGLVLTAQVSQPVIDYNPTIGVYFAGTVASMLIGLFYMLPLLVLGKYLSRKKTIKINVNKTLYMVCLMCIIFLSLSLVFTYLEIGPGVSLTSMSYVIALILTSGVTYYIGLRLVYNKTVDYYNDYRNRP